MSGSTWKVFQNDTGLRIHLINANEVNSNFDWMEGHICPQLAGVKTGSTYNLGHDGGSIYPFKSLYLDGAGANGGTIYFDNGTSKYIQSNALGDTLTFNGFSNFKAGNNVGITEYTNTSWDISNRQVYVWKFNESASITAYEQSGAHNLTAGTTTVTWPAGMLGNCTRMDANGEWWETADSPDFEPGTGDFTVCFWINMISHTFLVNTIFQKHTTLDPNNLFMLRVNNTGAVSIQFGVSIYTSGATVSDSQWYFMWFRRNSGNVSVGWTPSSTTIFDTTEQISVVDASSVGVNGAAFRIGDNIPTFFPMRAEIDQFIFCNGYSFSNNELKALFNKGVGTQNMRGLDYGAGDNIPMAESGLSKIFSCNTTDQFYSNESSGLQQLTGGIKLGELYGQDSSMANNPDWFHASKYTAYFDSIVTHIAVRFYQVTVGAKIKFGIYSHNDGGYPDTKLVETIEYTCKGNTTSGDYDTVEVIPLSTPLSLKAGTKYWIGFISSVGLNLYDLVNSVRTSHSQYWVDTTYAGGLPSTRTTVGVAWSLKALAAL